MIGQIFFIVRQNWFIYSKFWQLIQQYLTAQTMFAQQKNQESKNSASKGQGTNQQMINQVAFNGLQNEQSESEQIKQMKEFIVQQIKVDQGSVKKMNKIQTKEIYMELITGLQKLENESINKGTQNKNGNKPKDNIIEKNKNNLNSSESHHLNNGKNVRKVQPQKLTLCQKKNMPIQQTSKVIYNNQNGNKSSNSLRKQNKQLNEKSTQYSKCLTELPKAPKPHMLRFTKQQSKYIHPFQQIKTAIEQSNAYRLAYEIPLLKNKEEILDALKRIYPEQRMKLIQTFGQFQIKKQYYETIRNHLRDKTRHQKLIYALKAVHPVKNVIVYIPQKLQNTSSIKQNKLTKDKKVSEQIPNNVVQDQGMIEQNQGNIQLQEPQIVIDNQNYQDQDHVVDDQQMDEEPILNQKQSQFNKENQKGGQKKQYVATLVQIIQDSDQGQEMEEENNNQGGHQRDNADRVGQLVRRMSGMPAKLFIPDNGIPQRMIVNPVVKQWVTLLGDSCQQFKKNCPKYISADQYREIFQKQ